MSLDTKLVGVADQLHEQEAGNLASRDAIDRQRVLAPSRSGRFYVVLEIHSRRASPSGDSETEVEAFEVSGWVHGKARAGRRRHQLELLGLWLAESSITAMREGRVLRVRDLEWEAVG